MPYLLEEPLMPMPLLWRCDVCYRYFRALDLLGFCVQYLSMSSYDLSTNYQLVPHKLEGLPHKLEGGLSHNFRETDVHLLRACSDACRRMVVME